jgi:hypothetical protein
VLGAGPWKYVQYANGLPAGIFRQLLLVQVNMKHALAILSLLAAGCTSMEWYRADMSAAETEDDARQCADQAWRATAWNYPYPAYGFGPWGRTYYGPWGSPYNDRFMAENRLANFCMEAKGYRLESTRQ